MTIATNEELQEKLLEIFSQREELLKKRIEIEGVFCDGTAYISLIAEPNRIDFVPGVEGPTTIIDNEISIKTSTSFYENLYNCASRIFLEDLDHEIDLLDQEILSIVELILARMFNKWVINESIHVNINLSREKVPDNGPGRGLVDTW